MKKHIHTPLEDCAYCLHALLYTCRLIAASVAVVSSWVFLCRRPVTFHVFHATLAALPVLAAILYVEYLKRRVDVQDANQGIARAEWTNKRVLDKRLQLLEERLGFVPPGMRELQDGTSTSGSATGDSEKKTAPTEMPPAFSNHLISQLDARARAMGEVRAIPVDAGRLHELEERLASLEQAIVSHGSPPLSTPPRGGVTPETGVLLPFEGSLVPPTSTSRHTPLPTKPDTSSSSSRSGSGGRDEGGHRPVQT